MGEKQVFQPLTREDTITVMLYRAGIVLSAAILAILALLLATASPSSDTVPIGLPADILSYGLYGAVALSVFFIHLYIGKLKEYLKILYYISLAGLAALLVIGEGSLSGALLREPAGALLLLPLAGCLGFVTAKEAFCFRLTEGYLLAMIMPIYVLLVSGALLTSRAASYGLVLIAAMMILFTLRKVFMPLAYDIGDKTAYR